ncbi:transposon-encoded TnpW family protein [Ruminococcus albus]|uniref:Conserved domain protein n=1 Tax=Ruminococcus albus 8 TaxID=246199 RepID=E9SDD8_RUMAL|nr:transposon-encoded TnpW family protein [Ruminococcus albus]EGC02703.1 conserved domain protein [Ruminococcus albus 8]MCC3352884.1 transposon-encoded TnpW family protein [Ruminococcus albus 8]
MNNTTTTAVNAVSESVSEYHIGHTIYRVRTVFNPSFRESLSDILARLITEDCEKLLGETGQEPIQQAV